MAFLAHHFRDQLWDAGINRTGNINYPTLWAVCVVVVVACVLQAISWYQFVIRWLPLRRFHWRKITSRETPICKDAVTFGVRGDHQIFGEETWRLLSTSWWAGIFIHLFFSPRLNVSRNCTCRAAETESPTETKAPRSSLQAAFITCRSLWSPDRVIPLIILTSEENIIWSHLIPFCITLFVTVKFWVSLVTFQTKLAHTHTHTHTHLTALWCVWSEWRPSRVRRRWLDRFIYVIFLGDITK